MPNDNGTETNGHAHDETDDASRAKRLREMRRAQTMEEIGAFMPFLLSGSVQVGQGILHGLAMLAYVNAIGQNPADPINLFDSDPKKVAKKAAEFADAMCAEWYERAMPTPEEDAAPKPNGKTEGGSRKV